MRSDPRDYKVELSSQSQDAPARENGFAGRPYLSVLFNCCGVYQRIYRNPQKTAYTGRCPRCYRQVRFPIGQGGTSARFFVVE